MDISRTVLVTGASRGIGRAAAVAFAAQGDTVAVHYATNRAEEVASAVTGELLSELSEQEQRTLQRLLLKALGE